MERNSLTPQQEKYIDQLMQIAMKDEISQFRNTSFANMSTHSILYPIIEKEDVKQK